jgi:hypothetical protein
MPRKRDRKRAKLGSVRVRSERKPEPDWDKFAWALLQHAKALNGVVAKRRKGRSK